jgi:hypothetical protein
MSSFVPSSTCTNERELAGLLSTTDNINNIFYQAPISITKMLTVTALLLAHIPCMSHVLLMTDDTQFYF